MNTSLRSERHKRTRKRLSVPILVSGITAVILLCGILWGYSVLRSFYNDPTNRAELPRVKPGERINVLFLGVDSGTTASGKPRNVRSEISTRTDTMILASIDPETRKVGVLWIPRDSRVQIPGRSGYDKIAHAHAYGGPKLAMSTVSALLGVDVHYYVKTDFEGFAHLVDILGGVPMHIDHDMYYEDPYQGLKINLKAGDQILDGDKALQFVRYRRYPNGDIGRVQAQQKFAEAVIRKIFSVGTIPKIPTLAREAVNWVDTNVEPSRILSLANIARLVKESDITLATLPGAPAEIIERGQTVSYWVVDQEAARRTVELLIKGVDRNQNASITVEVLDGAKKPSAAQAMARMLSDAGFTVVRVGTADRSDYQVTEVVSRRPEPNAAKQVGRTVAVSAPAARLASRPIKDSNVDVTVIIGKDCTLK